MAAYATLTELKTFMRIPVGDTADDALLTAALDAATTLIDQACDTETVQISPVPAVVKLACEIQAMRLVKRRDAPYGVLGSAEFGNYSRLLAKLDPDVEVLINGQGERLPWGTTV